MTENVWPRRIFFLMLFTIIAVVIVVGVHNVQQQHEIQKSQYQKCLDRYTNGTGSLDDC